MKSCNPTFSLCRDPRWNDWKWQLAHRFHTIEHLASLMPGHMAEGLDDVISRYPWAVTPYYLSLADILNPLDPVSRQVIPSTDEIGFSIYGSTDDPLAEALHSPCPRLVHRYRDRALVITTGFCFSYCRHCNRKRNWTSNIGALSDKETGRIRDYFASRPEIREVILSGGDPLTLSVEKLDRILHALGGAGNIEVIRLGTRVPVVLPMRITGELVSMLRSHRPLWINTHFNHHVEITDAAASACDRLLTAGIPVSNHTVLLRGVNDDFEALHALFTGLNRIMVRPYYLFHCDAARGTDHFRTSITTGIRIMARLYGDTGGLCLPQYVVDLPSGGGKAPVMPSFLLGVEGETGVFRRFDGSIMKYYGVSGAKQSA